MFLKNLTKFTISIITIIAIVLIFGVNISCLQIIAGISLTLILPGYALTSFINSFDIKLKTADRILLTFGASIVWDILTGYILNLFPAGLTKASWALFLGVTILAFDTLTVFRKHGSHSNRPKLLPGKITLSKSDIYNSIIIFASIIIVIFSIEINRLYIFRQPAPSFTQLWIQPVGQTEPFLTSIGITSFEKTDTTFQLRVLVDGRVVKEWRQIRLRPGQKWGTALTLDSSAGGKMIEARLWRAGEAGAAYRRVYWWKGSR